MVRVKNIKGTEDNLPPSGYNSWEAYWEHETGRSFSKCSCSGCGNKVQVGEHVIKAGSADRRWYIVPLCYSCNNKRSDEVFEVSERDMVFASVKR